MKILVVDDEGAFCRNCDQLIKQIDKDFVVFKEKTAEDALFKIIDEHPQIILTKAKLPMRSGLELARTVNKLSYNFRIIVFSEDDSFAVDAIRSDIFDFIIDSEDNERKIQSVKNALQSIDDEERNTSQPGSAISNQIKFSTKSGFIVVNINELAYCKADGSYTNFYFIDGRIECSSYFLGRVESLLRNHNFVRINRSSVINVDYLKRVNRSTEECELEFNGENEVFKISKPRLKMLKEENY